MAQIIHIGYPKTATTWFQKEFFPNVEKYNKIIKHETLKYFMFDNENFEKTDNYLNKFKNAENLIISDEDLITNKPEHISPEKKAVRIKNIFPNARIIIFIRNQTDIILSAYYQYIKGGGVLCFDEYFKFLIKSNKIDYWNYHKIIKMYINLFGKDSVKVYLYEDFKNNTSFIDNFINEFNFEIKSRINLKIKQNRKLIFFVSQCWRNCNKFTKHQIYSAFPPKKYIFHIPGFFTFNKIFFSLINKLLYVFCCKENAKKNMGIKNYNFIKEYYKNSNNQLKDFIFFDKIKEYNYPL